MIDAAVSRGLGAALAHAFAAEGAHVAINYASNAEAATSLAETLRKKHGVTAITVQGDAGKRADIERCVSTTKTELGGLDVVIANAGWTRFSKFADLDALSEEEWDKCWAVNVKGPLALLRAAMPTFDANEDGGVCLITSSVAGRILSGSSMAYSVTKAAQLHLMRCMAKTQGKKVRVNAVLPGLLLTEWGLSYGEEAIKTITNGSALKRETDMQDCANTFVMLAKNTSMTGQEVIVDSGLEVAGR
ncbi:hypothetical protein ANO11243_075160 [Dothideomycetidae sp. 11243]|nr:hypothetical protein ANO11243_075160 [fungal sp. No.11243]